MVATEIGHLAELTSEATGSIGAKITEIQRSLDIAASSIGKIVAMVETIEDLARKINENIHGEISLVGKIRKSATLAVDRAKDVKKDVTIVRQTSEQANEASKQIQSASAKLSEVAMKLNASVRQLKA